jgi:hypothetical protein
VEKGESLAVFFSDGDKQKIDSAKVKFLSAYAIGDLQCELPKLFYARVSGNKVEEFSQL